MEIARKILSTVNSVTSDTSATVRHQDHAPPSTTNSKLLNARHRAHTVRPKTAYFSGHDDTDNPGISATITGHAVTAGGAVGDHVISYPVPVPKASKPPKEKKKVGRSSTFRSKEKKEDKKEDKDKEKVSGLVGVVHQQGVVMGDEKSRASEQLYIKCITSLNSSLEEIMVRKVLLAIYLNMYLFVCIERGRLCWFGETVYT